MKAIYERENASNLDAAERVKRHFNVDSKLGLQPFRARRCSCGLMVSGFAMCNVCSRAVADRRTKSHQYDRKLKQKQHRVNGAPA